MITYQEAERWMSDPGRSFSAINSYGDVFTLGNRGSVLVSRDGVEGIMGPHTFLRNDLNWFPLDILFLSCEDARASLEDSGREIK